MIFDSDVLVVISTKDDGNIAFHVEDKKENVISNRQALAEKYKYNYKNLVYMDQIHSSNIKIVNNSSQKLQEACDALITNMPNLPLMVMIADCIPVLIYDKIKKVIAVVHAGRNGIFLNITGQTIDMMKKEFGSMAGDIEVFIAPSIQQCCYEVDEKLVSIAEKNFGKQFIKNNYLDLQAMCQIQIIQCGILEKNIQIDDYCTKCGGDRYFSYRKDGKKAGRFAAVMMLKDKERENE